MYVPPPSPSPSASAPSQAVAADIPLATRLAALRADIGRLDTALWKALNAGADGETQLAALQSAWRRLESVFDTEPAAADTRHHFMLVIPVADSPAHLERCLDSLASLCRAFAYGGQADGRWRKVSVLLADDSARADARDQHRALAERYTQQGIAVEYFGPEAQLALLDALLAQAPDLGPALHDILGEHPRHAFHRKGQAMTRNLAALRCARIAAEFPHERWLFYTLDADQRFAVNTPHGGQALTAVNYLRQLDDIFQNPAIRILTGKVVGDPPVSPAAMAGNFLADALGLLRELSGRAPFAPYRQPEARRMGDAAYHDMADLFGFRIDPAAWRYRCPLPGTPTNAACLAEFARGINGFFHGRHPTRITGYIPGDPPSDVMPSVLPARTLYTGNAVFRPAALEWFIPFAPLRLRMSGPTLGRLLKAELGPGFVSANLPMLHARTVDGTGQSEFRPGVHDTDAVIDISDEFERQFHGDVMLFTVQELAERGYPARMPAAAEVDAQLARAQCELLDKYRARQARVLADIDQFNALLEDPAHWWHADPGLAPTVQRLRAFAANLERNFGARATAPQRIEDPALRAAWRARQTAALLGLPAARQAWTGALARARG